MAQVKQFIKIGWPVGLGLMLSTVLGLVDLGFVSTLGKTAIAGVGLVGSVYWLLTILPDLFGAGVLAAVARAIGKGDYDEAGAALRAGLGGTWVMALAISVLGFILSPSLLSFFKVEPDVFNIGVSFFRIILLSFPFLATVLVANAALYGAGYTSIPLFIMGGANIINIILNPCLILGLGPFPCLGTDGSALATLVSTFLAAVAVLIYLNLKHSPVKPFAAAHRNNDRKWLSRLLKVGVNAAAQSLMRPLTATFLYRIVSAFGTSALASFAIGTRCLNFIFIFTSGFNVAASSLVGQSLGRHDHAEAKRVCSLALRITLIIQLILSLAYFFGSDLIISIFNITGDAQLAIWGSNYLRIIAVGLMLGFMGFPIAAIFRGAGDTAPPMWAAFIGNWPIKLGLAYLFSGLIFSDLPRLSDILGGTINWGVEGIWWGICASLTVEGWVLWIFFRSGRWQWKKI